MTYIKHPEHGNRHVSEDAVAVLVAEGWTIWPRSKEAKAGLTRIEFQEAAPELAEITPTLDSAPLPPAKRAYRRKVAE